MFSAKHCRIYFVHVLSYNIDISTDDEFMTWDPCQEVEMMLVELQ